MQHPRLILATAAFGFLAALPALAATGDVSSIGLQDFNHDGKIDRAVVSIANAASSAWQVHGTAGLKVTYQGQPIAVWSAFMASTGDPAQLEVVFDANDPNLPRTTSAAGFSLTYVPQGAANGVSDGTHEMAAIGADVVPLDQAPPILLSSDPMDAAVDTTRDTDLHLTFSEPIVASSAVASSAQNPDSWGYSADGDVLTVSHAPYGRGVTESFGIDATDAAGNHVALGSYPNPFSFRTATTNNPIPSTDTVFVMTSPLSLQSLQAGTPSLLAWYTNDASAASVRLSYSKDGGQTYLPIATRPVIEGTSIWYPPTVQGAIQLKAEALSSIGSVVNVSIVSAVSVTGGAGAPERVLSGPDIARISATAAKATLWLDRAPEKAAASCGGQVVTVTQSGDRPVRLEALAEGLTAVPETCRFTLSDTGSAAVTLETQPIAAESQATPPQGEGFVTLNEDDLIKAQSSSAVYWYKGGKRWVFANETIYLSWFGPDFSKVITVPQDQLASLMIGGNVKMKEGVFLIKIQSDPKTYAVEPDGVLRWIQTEAQAQSLYGAAWAKRVRDVDVSLFVDYTIGAPLQDGERPAGFQS